MVAPSRSRDEFEAAVDSYESERVLDAVERWAWGAWMLRERELHRDSTPDDPRLEAWRKDGPIFLGRIDALLVPLSLAPDAPLARLRSGWWAESRRLLGVEVKVSRSDFMRGLREGQFERYGEGVGGLFLATPAGLVKRSEVPPEVGILEVRRVKGQFERAAACVRRPKVRDVQPSAAMFWTILHDLYARVEEDRRARSKRIEKAFERFGRRAAEAIRSAIEA